MNPSRKTRSDVAKGPPEGNKGINTIRSLTKAKVTTKQCNEGYQSNDIERILVFATKKAWPDPC